MNDQLTFADLEHAGTDAGALWDAHYREVETAAGSTPDKATRVALAAELKRLSQLHAEYFGEVAA